MPLTDFSRKKLLIWITGFWGIWTLAIALVANLSQLFFVRIMSSLGLGVLWPTAFSLISDLFPSKEAARGRHHDRGQFFRRDRFVCHPATPGSHEPGRMALGVCGDGSGKLCDRFYYVPG